MKAECVIVFIDELPRDQAELLCNVAAKWTEAGWPVRLIVSDGVELPNLPPEVAVYPAGGTDARSRTTAVVAAFASGIEAVAIIDERALAIPQEFIRLAFENLSGARAVAIGPSGDTFYIVVMNDLFPDVIAASAGNEKRFDDLLTAASDARSITILPTWP